MHIHINQNGRVGQSRSLGNFYLCAKNYGPMVIRSTFLFSHWNRESKTDDPVIISSLAFSAETKISSDSLYPTIVILSHPTLGLSFHFHLSVAMQYLAKQHKIAVSFSKANSGRPTCDQDSNLISCMIRQSTLENKIFVAISQNTCMFEFCCLREEKVNCLAKSPL